MTQQTIKRWKASFLFPCFLASTLFATTLALPIKAETPKKTTAGLQAPAIGAKVENITLVDTYRRERSLSDCEGRKAIVLVVLGVECPLANLYIPRLNDLHKEFDAKGVQFAAINANPHDSMIRVAGHALETKMEFPVLKDFEQKAVRALGAKRTPEVFLLDSNHVIQYHGRIDDQFTISHRRPKAKRYDLKIAIEQLLAGEEITVKETSAHGCLIPAWEDQLPKEEITYSSHIAKIFDAKCYQCHRDGQVGPFALNEYQDAKTWAEPIYESVVEQRMPPWHADEADHTFSNDRSLTRTEIEQVVKWVKDDCPPGDLSTVAAKPVFKSEWSIGKPDLVVEMPRIEKVPATGVVPYRYQRAAFKFEEDVWVQAAEAKPGTPEVVHHILGYIYEPRTGEKKHKKGLNLFGRDGSVKLLVGWAPGDLPQIYPAGVARRIPKGSQLIFELHYTPDGVKRTDRSAIALKFTKEPPEYEAQTNFMAQTRLKIPAHSFGHQETRSYTFKKDARILSFMPHMHWRGLRAQYEMEYPDGRKEIVLSVPYFDFNWQSVYRFEKPFEVPKGTKVTITGTWDNSADNPNNPDPTKTIRWGQQTWEEMLAGWVDFVYAHPEKEALSE